MTKEERLFYCAQCINRKFDRQIGTLCGLTDKLPDFEIKCNTYSFDVELEKRAIIKAKNKELVEEKSKLNAVMHGSIWGGILMMIGGVIWLFWGLSAGLFFFYAPILIFLGLVSFVTGILKQKRLYAAKKKNSIDVLDNLKNLD